MTVQFRRAIAESIVIIINNLVFDKGRLGRAAAISRRQKIKYHLVDLIIGNVELMHTCFLKHLHILTARMK